MIYHFVSRNHIFIIKWRYFGPKGIFWTIGGNSYFVYYYIISYQRIKVYRVEIMDMGIYH